MCAFARFTAGGARRLQSLPVPSFRSTNLAPSVTSFGRAVPDLHGMKESSMSKQFAAAPAACSKIEFSGDEAVAIYGARCVRLGAFQKFASHRLQSACQPREGK
jgi:hypothetical protein